MNEDNSHDLTLTTPPAWESFGQWVIYGIVLFMTIVVIIFIFKMIFPGKSDDKDEK
ncbi:MAG: hypothetical protein OEW58_00340 [Gammaproteobacteria bacterium]|nr:hypothetical protein [Gammaproteobacteria bacterium]